MVRDNITIAAILIVFAIVLGVGIGFIVKRDNDIKAKCFAAGGEIYEPSRGAPVCFEKGALKKL